MKEAPKIHGKSWASELSLPQFFFRDPIADLWINQNGILNKVDGTGRLTEKVHWLGTSSIKATKLDTTTEDYQ